MMKKGFALLLSAVLLVSAIMLPVSAATIEDNGIQPLWSNTSLLNANITFVDGVGYAEAVVIGYNGCSSAKIDVTVYVQSGNDWVYLAEEHVSESGNSALISCAFAINEGGSYKADYTFTVTDDGVDEVITRTVYNTYNP